MDTFSNAYITQEKDREFLRRFVLFARSKTRRINSIRTNDKLICGDALYNKGRLSI